MKRALTLLNKLLNPPKIVLFFLPPIVFAVLIYIFIKQQTENALAYLIYGMSAYSFTILVIAFPKMIRQLRLSIKNSKAVSKLSEHKMIGRYLNDLAFRGSISIYQGMTVNFLYVVFRIAAGIRYASVWFISMALYYLVLGCLRFYLIVCYRHRNEHTGYRCYLNTARFLFLLNIPMGAMIALMIITNSGFTYPGYIIYLSALYFFYTMTMSIVNLVKFRKLGDPILSAARVLNFISAMMSILGLQTAMISRFAKDNDSYRRMMNTITGGFVYVIVIVIAVYMLIHSRKWREVKSVEQIRE